MAINQNHLFEELNGVKCAIVEKNVLPARVDFLRRILEANHYTVVVVPSPPPKAPPAAPPPDIPQQPSPPPPPETFNVGVTDVMFNPINAIFGRLLKTPDGRTVTLAYWQQKDPESHDETPYFAAPVILAILLLSTIAGLSQPSIKITKRNGRQEPFTITQTIKKYATPVCTLHYIGF